MKQLLKRKLFLGDIVATIPDSLMGNPKHSLGLVVEEYDFGYGPGVLVIFPNGNSCGFSVEEQAQMFMKMGESKIKYNFTNVMNLDKHFRWGVFNSVFQELTFEILLQK